MNAIAMYLPQFHNIKENDKWWGKGYTDWVAVKQAEPLFKGHRQPRKPLNDNYYNLLDTNVIEWQSILANKYGITGFCFYHYYFENGKKILEKPVELFLQNHSINISFCLCWANEQWARSWSGIRRTNSWSEKYDNSLSQQDGNGVLLRQDYGDISYWKDHFYELFPFFSDDRYIKNEGRPIFLLYRPDQIPCLRQMRETWDKLCEKEKIRKIYLIGMNTTELIDGLDAILINGPAKYLPGVESKNINGIHIYDYDKVWKNALSMKGIEGIDTFFGAFTSFDNSPRNGYKSIILDGGTPEKFLYYLEKLRKKNEQLGNEYLFINAWNEWGEGMYLEPDIEYKYSWLQAVKNACG